MLRSLLCLALQLFFFALLGSIVLSWFPPGGDMLESIRALLHRATEWALAPLRRVVPPLRLGAAALDLSPLILIIGVQILSSRICG